MFAAYMDSDPHFAVVRAFGTLRARLLLLKQTELGDLEAELEFKETAIQKPTASSPGPTVLQSRARYQSGEREVLVTKISNALKEYGKATDSLEPTVN